MIKLFNCNCLDFLKSQDCEELLKNRKVVIVTDPPFNIGYHYNSYIFLLLASLGIRLDYLKYQYNTV